MLSRWSASSPKKAQNLMAGIEASKERSLARLLFGLNIRHLGGAVGEFLADAFGNLDEIIAASEDEFGRGPRRRPHHRRQRAGLLR